MTGSDGRKPGARTRLRLASGLVALAASVVLFREPLASALPLLWPPGGPRWASLAALVALSLAGALAVGAGIAELYLSWRG
ncbi:MAG: hypothetical protein ABEI11_03590 [Haloarculaceae archaeon]